MARDVKLFLEELKTLELLKMIENLEYRFPTKNVQESVNSRLKGNDLYKKRHHTAEEHEEILRCYSKSVAYAPNRSEEQAVAYSNRSALLLHLGRHDDCMSDIDRALGITESEQLREKLIKRKEQCLKALDGIKVEMNTEISSVDGGDDGLKKLEDFSNLSIQESNGKALEMSSQSRSVAVRYNEKFGRYLVATRNFKPGEIIFAEKPYINGFSTQKLHTHCGHCLVKAWASIPCDNCGWFMYCSNACKEEAWKQYHDIECCCIIYITTAVNIAKNEYNINVSFDSICVRAMIKGLREAGSLKKFKSELKSIDNCTDKHTRGFSDNGKFESSKFRSLYSLSNNVSEEELKSCIKFSVIALTCLAKYTKLLGDYKFTNAEELSKNSDAMFFGLLILKLIKINCINSHFVMNVTNNIKYGNGCRKGTCIVPIASLTNHSCNPNVRRCFADQKFILYALQPIKKNSQLFDSYYSSFYENANPLRRNLLKQNFDFDCDCIACKSNWPCYPILPPKKIHKDLTLNPEEVILWKYYEKVIESIDNNEIIQYDEKLIQTISTAIEKSFSLTQPSAVTYKMIYTLIIVFEKVHGYKTEVSEEC